MSWSRKKAEDKMERLLGACQDPQQAIKWAPHLANFCEEISALGAGSRRRRQAEILTVLMRAGPYFASRGQVPDFMRWVDPLLDDPEKHLVDDVFMVVTDSILQSAQWGGILEALEALQTYTSRRNETRIWVAYAKALANAIDAMYALGRFSTADAAHVRFEAVPAKHRSVTRLYQAQALVSKARHHARDGDGARVPEAAAELQELYKEQPSQALRHNLAAVEVEAIRVLVQEGRIERCLERSELLFTLVSKYPEDSELGITYFHHLALALASYLDAEIAEAPLERMGQLIRTFKESDALGEVASELLLAMAESHPELVKEKLDQIRPTLEEVEKRFARRSLTAGERCARFRALVGLPPRSAGCLVLLALGAAAGLGLG